MKEPEQEQAAIDRYIQLEVLVLDDLGVGPDTPFNRQVLQEILDARDFRDRSGLVISSKYNLNDLARKLNDDSIPSRLSGMCQIIEVKGVDCRVRHGAHAVV
jgi:DNA replication protein DnaC